MAARPLPCHILFLPSSLVTPPTPPGMQEWRHQNGMKALGIPNTRQFFEVTTIADALALWKNLQEREKGKHASRAERQHMGHALHGLAVIFPAS